MKDRKLVTAIFTCMFCLSTEAAAQKSKCIDPGLNFTIYSSFYADPNTGVTYMPGILSDGVGPYVNADAGVSAVLKVCEGTNDAVLTLSKTRVATIRLSNTVSTTGKTPSWVTGPISFGGLNVWNILYDTSATPGNPHDFTTGMGVSGLQNTADSYRLENPLREAARTTEANVNTPCATSLVHVRHFAADASTTPPTLETWLVWPDSAPVACQSITPDNPMQVGTLLSLTGPLTNIGQFSVPFYIRIQRP